MSQKFVYYNWFGGKLPVPYAKKLMQVNYPVVFRINPPIQKKFDRELKVIEKADYDKLWYVWKNGGIYSDFDNDIKYQCLLQLLKDVDCDLCLPVNKKYENPAINLIYSSKKQSPLIRQILDSADTSAGIGEFMGMHHYSPYKDRVTLINMDQCVTHRGDWSWHQQSNKQTGLNTEPKPHWVQLNQQALDSKSSSCHYKTITLIFILILIVIGLFYILVKRKKIRLGQKLNTENVQEQNQVFN